MTNLADTQPGRTKEPPKEKRSGMGRPVDYWLLWLIALASLALNVWLINTLVDTRRRAAQALRDAAMQIGQLELGAVEYSVHVDETVPVSGTVPISDTLIVPVKKNFPINTTVFVDLGVFGRQPLPVSMVVPIDFEVTVPLSLSYGISLTVPVKMDIPVNIALEETPFGDLRTQAKDYLLNLSEELGGIGNPALPLVDTATPN